MLHAQSCGLLNIGPIVAEFSLYSIQMYQNLILVIGNLHY
jgi:hypothetical protein